MPEVTRRRTGEMLRILFEFLIPQPEGMQARDALAELERRLTLSEYEQGEFPSGGRRFEKIVRFATVDLVKAGWLLKEKGRWTVTQEGKQAFQTLTDPEAFYKEAVRLFHQWRARGHRSD
jgi:restriction system protein